MDTTRSIIRDAVDKLSVITEKDPIDWVSFDSILTGLEDINVYDNQHEDTILSELFICGGFQERGNVLTDVVRHFLECGYDATANDGMNGGAALGALGWSSYDHLFLDAAKVLMNAGAPVNYRSRDDATNRESEGLLGNIRWKLSGAWFADKDFGFANVLEAYYAIAEANLAGKDYNSIDTYFTCIDKPLTAVSAIRRDGSITLQKEGNISVYTEPFVMWFGDRPLTISCYTDFVVNPVYAEDNKAILEDVSAEFSAIIGTELKELQYIGPTICYFAFSNGVRLIFASRNTGDNKRVGAFEIRPYDNATEIEHVRIDSICGITGVRFADHVTDYCEDSLALFSGDTSCLLYPRIGAGRKYKLEFCSCSPMLLTDYTRQYPLKSNAKTAYFYDQNNLSAIRLDFAEGFLYVKTLEYNDIDVRLSDEAYDPLEHYTQRDDKGKHMEFETRAP